VFSNDVVQQRAAARGAGTEDAGVVVRSLAAALPGSAHRSELWRRCRNPPRPQQRPDQIGGRVDLCRRGADWRTGWCLRDRRRRLAGPLCRRRTRIYPPTAMPAQLPSGPRRKPAWGFDGDRCLDPHNSPGPTTTKRGLHLMRKRSGLHLTSPIRWSRTSGPPLPTSLARGQFGRNFSIRTLAPLAKRSGSRQFHIAGAACRVPAIVLCLGAIDADIWKGIRA
jgi:hypothetical protein